MCKCMRIQDEWQNESPTICQDMHQSSLCTELQRNSLKIVCVEEEGCKGLRNGLFFEHMLVALTSMEYLVGIDFMVKVAIGMKSRFNMLGIQGIA